MHKRETTEQYFKTILSADKISETKIGDKVSLDKISKCQNNR